MFITKFYRYSLPKKSGILINNYDDLQNSVPANIAEGYGRFYYQENIRFCYNARGSLEETLSHLVMCYELKFMPKSLLDSLKKDGEKLTQLINGYIGYLKRSKQGQNEPGVKQSVREDIVPYEIDLPESPEDK